MNQAPRLFRLGALAFAAVLFILSGCAPRPYRGLSEALGLPPETQCTVTPTQVKLLGGGHTLTFNRGKRPAEIDGTLYYLNTPAGMNAIAEHDLALIRQAILCPPPAKGHATLMLDPGHGAADTGCRAGKTYEKHITLAVALEVKRLLEAQGFTILMTRDSDQHAPSLEGRATLAAASPIDGFISIHVNSAKNPEAKGIELYTLPAPGCDGTAEHAPARAPMVGQNYLAQATRLAFCVQRALLASGEPKRADRGLRHAHFKVLRDTPAPAILIELGFLTNAQEFPLLAESAGQQRLASAIARGLQEAFAP